MLAHMKKYKPFGGAKELPGSIEADARFARLSAFYEYLPDPKNYTEAVAGAISLMRVAQVPFRDPARVPPEAGVWGAVQTNWISAADLAPCKSCPLTPCDRGPQRPQKRDVGQDCYPVPPGDCLIVVGQEPELEKDKQRDGASQEAPKIRLRCKAHKGVGHESFLPLVSVKSIYSQSPSTEADSCCQSAGHLRLG
jgi:hypothetical protein